MPYLALDLDAREKCELVARACDARPGDVLWGLTGLWLHVWRTESATVPTVVLAGCFGAHPGMPDALEAFGFIERTPEGIRIRGADRYLRIRQAQREGGKKGRAKSSSPVGDLTRTSTPNKVSPRSTLKSTSRSPQALTASSEQRAASIKKEEEPPLPIRPEDPYSSPEAFWAEAQVERREQGLITEKPPHPAKLSHWWSEALGELEGDPQPLGPAYYKFVRDKFWLSKTPPAPFPGFISQWRNYVQVRPQASAN